MGKHRTTPPASFDHILQQRYHRRTLIRGLGIGALAAWMPLPLRAAQPVAEPASIQTTTLNFTEVGRGMDAQHHLAAGYRAQTFLRWGDAVLPAAPVFDPQRQRPEAQAMQIGYNSDYIAYFPIAEGDRASRHGLLCINHEYTQAEMMFAGYPNAATAPSELTEKENHTAMAAHGVSVLEVEQDESGQWHSRMGRYNRRITATTPIRISGAAAGDARMKTSADPSGRQVLGTFNNCAGGVTPWRTYLTCEENIDAYFNLNGYRGDEQANHEDMTIGSRLYHRWDTIDPRFDVKQEPNEPNRFGWVVEIDPFDPGSRPVKRTSLGRFKHESASPTLAPDGEVVVYMGDDQAFQHLYRYVSDAAYEPEHRSHNQKLLDDGTLFVARFDADGTMQWLPMVYGEGPLTEANGFRSQADVLIETRRAARLLGATPMDRPEDVEVNPANGRVYACMSKNPLRSTTDAVNRRAPNPMGYVLELIPPKAGDGRNHRADNYRWELLLEGGDPEAISYRQGNYGGPVTPQGFLACPDNLAFDPEGRIWISTDGQEDAIKSADALYAAEVAGDHRGVTKCFFRGPIGCEITGPCFTPDGKTLFVSVQHPGYGSVFKAPSTRWPDFDEDTPPRSAVLAITKEDGGVIGG